MTHNNTTTQSTGVETMNTSELQNKLTERLAEAGFSGAWWGPADDAERFYFSGASVEMKRKGKPVRGNKAWLEFDAPATLEGVCVHATAKKAWHKQALAQNHADAALIAIELVNPAEAKRLRAEIDAARDADEPVGDLVAGEPDASPEGAGRKGGTMADDKTLPGRQNTEEPPEWETTTNEVMAWLKFGNEGSMYNDQPSALYDVVLDLVNDLAALVVVRNGEFSLTSLQEDMFWPSLERAEELSP